MKTRYIVGGIVGLAIVGVAYYGLSPLFRHIKVDEAAPLEQTQTSGQNAAAPAQVLGTAGHPASGSAHIVRADGKSYIRYENLKTINGPDLYVYLSKDLNAKEFVSLGTLRATEGNVNYEIPAGVEPKDYRYVLTWCKQFGVLFNSADLLPR